MVPTVSVASMTAATRSTSSSSCRRGAGAKCQQHAGPTVTSQPVTDGAFMAAGAVVVANGSFGADLQAEIADPGGIRNGQLMVRVHGILHPSHGAATAGGAGQPCLSATWRLADGDHVRGILATRSTCHSARRGRKDHPLQRGLSPLTLADSGG
jgi:hypothetical protein